MLLFLSETDGSCCFLWRIETMSPCFKNCRYDRPKMLRSDHQGTTHAIGWLKLYFVLKNCCIWHEIRGPTFGHSVRSFGKQPAGVWFRHAVAVTHVFQDTNADP